MRWEEDVASVCNWRRRPTSIKRDGRWIHSHADTSPPRTVELFTELFSVVCRTGLLDAIACKSAGGSIFHIILAFCRTKLKGAYRELHHRATERHLLYGITIWHRWTRSALTPASAGWYSIYLPRRVWLIEQGLTRPTRYCYSAKLGHHLADVVFLVLKWLPVLSQSPCLFQVFTAARLEAVLFLSPDQQSGIHCLKICASQLLTLWTFWAKLEKHLYSLDNYRVSQKIPPEGSWHFSFFHKRLRIFNRFLHTY